MKKIIINKKRLGENIKAKRIEKGWSREKLAGKLDVTEKTIYFWERGKSAPRTATMLMLTANVLECKISELWEGVTNGTTN